MRLKDLKNLRNTYCGDEYYTEYTRHTIFASDDHNSVIIELEDGQVFNLEDLGFVPTSFKLESVTRVITPDDQGDLPYKITIIL